MFCDLVGSTALASRLDPEDLREVLGAYHECIAKTIARFNGFLARYMGDGVMVYFGYSRAHEYDAERAVRAGLAQIEAVRHLQTPERLQIRIGIGTGVVVIGELGRFGKAQEWDIVGVARLALAYRIPAGFVAPMVVTSLPNSLNIRTKLDKPAGVGRILVLAFTRRALLRSIGSAGVIALSFPEPMAAAPPYHKRVLAKQPVAYWRFEEQTGPTAHDGTTYAHAGTYRGGVAFRQIGPIHSERDAAIGLNGVDAFVEVPDSEAFSQPTSRRGLTVEAWFRPDMLTFTGQTEQHYVHWLGKGQAGEFEWGFRFYSKDSPRPNRVSAYMWNLTTEPGVKNEGAGAYFQDELQPGRWIHVVACYDPGDASNPHAGVSIYKNGELRGGPSSSPGARYATYDIRPAHGSAPLRLGTRDQGSFLAGGLDDVEIYPRVLSATEILNNYIGA